MPSVVRALRGATTVEVDEPEHITERMLALFTELFERNGIDHDDLISIVFTATDDIHSTRPSRATAKSKVSLASLEAARPDPGDRGQHVDRDVGSYSPSYDRA